jgi:hypothetical protein
MQAKLSQTFVLLEGEREKMERKQDGRYQGDSGQTRTEQKGGLTLLHHGPGGGWLLEEFSTPSTQISIRVPLATNAWERQARA